MRTSLAAATSLLITACVLDDPDALESEDAAEATTTANWVVSFQDEFRGTALDRSKWSTRYKWGGRTLLDHNEQECYVDGNVSVGSGRLTLKAERRTVTCDGVTLPYASGMVSAHTSMTQLHGYFEMRAQLPAGRGFWPAFWLLSQNDGNVRGEIDIVELLGHEPDKAYMNVHWEENGINQGLSTAYRELYRPNYASAYHTFAVEWKPSVITWYIDGVERKRFTTALDAGSYIPYEPMYLIANLAVGGDWPGSPAASTPFPSYMRIDYIRALRRTGAANTKNLVRNPGFESGTTSWSPYGGDSISTLAHAGTRAARLDGQGGFEQTVTVRPYTRYTLRAHIRSLDGGSTSLGVKDHDGQPLYDGTNAATYTQRSLTFTTGNTTTAKVFVYQASGSSVTDSFVLVEAP